MDELEEVFCKITFCGECRFFKPYKNDYFTGVCTRTGDEMVTSETCGEVKETDNVKQNNLNG
ncbi:MAG: hypothetical protein J6L85_02885 [Clostridia bacterium]|nr:hypothetical protein [Clostridia bacterium]